MKQPGGVESGLQFNQPSAEFEAILIFPVIKLVFCVCFVWVALSASANSASLLCFVALCCTASQVVHESAVKLVM